MKNWLYSLFFSLVSLVLFGANDPHISLSKVTPDGGVAYSQVTSIIEDTQGFIWFSTNNGLFSYNAINIKRYSYLQNDPTTISTNRINTLFKDALGKLWVTTENGLCSYNPKKDNFNRHAVRDQNDRFIGKNIISFFQDHNDTYWFLDENGIATLNPENNSAFYKNTPNKNKRITFATINAEGTIWVFYEDGAIYYLPKDSNTFQFFKKGLKNAVRSVLFGDDIIWIGYHSEGLLALNMKDGAMYHHFNSTIKTDTTPFPSNRIRSLVKDENNFIWAATDNGVAIIGNNTIKSIITKQKYAELPHHSIWSLYKDSNKNIWIGTWLGGLAFHNTYNNSFQHFTQSTSKTSLNSNIISCFSQVPNTPDILVGTDDGDLNLYHPETNIFNTIPVICEGDTIRKIKSITYDKHQTLWVGTYKNGVLFRKKNQHTFTRLTPPFSVGFQVFDMLATNEGLWVSNYPLGVYFYNFESETFTQYAHNPLDINSISNNNIRHIVQDKKQNIWFATENGLNLLKKGSTQFIRTFHQKDNPNSISHNYMHHIYEDKKGILWLGTNGEGLDKFNPETGLAEHFTMKDGLNGNEIFSILQDENDNLWVTTENGLCKFNPDSNSTQSFVSNKGIQNNHFYPMAALKSTHADLYFGGSNGLIRFQPNAISTNPVAPTSTITKLFIHNEEILPQSNNKILKDIISNTESLKLNHKQNAISFQFTSNNYINPQKNTFKYRLAGFDNKWITSGYNGQATFTNVPPGNYVFEIVGANNYGIWNDTPTQISIEITPPFWLTWYAYLLYGLLFIASVYIFRKQVINRQKLKLAVKMSEIQRETEEELHQMKLRFFTNISHEFRTPLTLIQGPVNRLLKTNTENDFAGKQLSLIKNNTDRLLRLINQFLDFRRIDHGKLKLNPIHTDIVSFCKNVFNCFEAHAHHRNFKFNFISETPSLNMDFDTDKLDKVLVNLLSNAFKYSSDNGSISVKIQSNTKTEKHPNWNHYTIGDDIVEDFIEISITDSGYGMSSEDLPKIFERFFQIENNHNTITGTGIGLSLSTNYIALHGGQLIVSTLKDEGTVFYIYLPQHQANTFTDASEKRLKPTTFDFTSEPLTNTDTKTKTDVLVDNQEALVLIAEDNPELLDFLEESLHNHFRIAKAKNGKEAHDLAMSLYPDLIISDIMMPEMDGIQLCEKIKNDIRTSHIPVILLTALDTVQDKITGLHSGADAYVPKPFNDDFLIVQINNLLNSRKMLRGLFASQPDAWEANSETLSLDKKLLNKAIQTIENNMTNTDFTVEDFAKHLNLSRTHLHRKLKSLTNQSATEFIRNIRLKHAIKLMKSGSYKINEIGYAVGFNSHNYFTKAFKKEYGKSPSEFIKEHFRLQDR
ncbi:two-component regulator propeller domain-containing protein [Algibacter sp. 2305UL17-15]|uniref:hybrid sensor histidine kinase/response regulator transcription factor n=1 Tax=Algibacter sp. 2305UL17-15 TaxID=3231268 RepID=UPI00345964CF